MHVKCLPVNEQDLPQGSRVEKTRARIWGVWILWLFVIVIAGLRLYWNRYTMGPDGVSYIDAADLFRGGHWIRGVNGLWGPLYSLLIAGVLRVAAPLRTQEVVVAHVANFIIFMLGAGAFLFFWKAFLEEVIRRIPATRNTRDSVWWDVIGCSLYAFTAFNVYTLPTMSPDLLVQASLTAAAGFLLRLSGSKSNSGNIIGLGAVLGLGYLAKAVVLPLAIVFFVLAFWRTGRTRKAVQRLLPGLAVFLLIAAPYVYAMSQRKGRLSLGDASRLNYAWKISWDYMPEEMWDGEPVGTGSPVHPPRRIQSSPDIFEFASPIDGTYPPWLDPPYWNEGLTAPFRPGKQLRALAVNFATLAKVTILDDREVTLCFLFLVVCIWRKPTASGISSELNWTLFLIAAAGFGLYCLIHVEQRYFGALDIFLWAAVLGYAAPRFTEDRRLLRAMGISLFVAVLSANGLVVRNEYSHRKQKDTNLETAEALLAQGIKSGDRVAVIGSGAEAAWAQIAGLRITVMVPSSRPGLSDSPEAMFWENNQRMSESLAVIRSTGVVAVISQQPPPFEQRGWERLGSTTRYVLKF